MKFWAMFVVLFIAVLVVIALLSGPSKSCWETKTISKGQGHTFVERMAVACP